MQRPTDPSSLAQARARSIRRHELRVRLLIVLAALALAAGLVALAVWTDKDGVFIGRFARPAPAAQAQPAPPPMPDEAQPGYLPLTEDEARSRNQQTAVSSAPIEAASPFRMPDRLASPFARISALDCLAAAVYYEAATESLQGQRAVAQVVINRMKHPTYPNSICGVVYQGSERATGCQFSFTCDGSLARRPSLAGWARARNVAMAALSGFVEPSVGTATHYHADYVVPYWASSLDKVAVIGTHIFYRWKGYWGKRQAFVSAYSGDEKGGAAAAAASTASDLPAELTAPQYQPGLTVPAVPEGPRPLADQAGSLLVPRHVIIAPPSQAPSIDNERGTLKADEASGVLIDRMQPAGADSAPPATAP